MKKRVQSVKNAQVTTFAMMNAKQLKTSIKPQKNIFHTQNVGKIASALLLLLLFFGNTWTLQAQENYDLSICGVVVNDLNCDALNEIDGVTGYVVYDNDTKTLTLDGATITGAGVLIDNDIENLKIELRNKNTISSTSGYTSISTSFNATIEGTGSGDSLVNNKNLYAYRSQLTIKNCYVECSNIIASTAVVDNEKLFLDNATIKAGPESTGAIRGFSNISFTDCTIISPEDAEFNSLKQGIVGSDGNLVTEQIVIEPAYELKIAGVQVTPQNCNDLSQIAGVEGSVIYYPAGKTLALQNATINGSIENLGIENLRIGIFNENTITSNNTSIKLLEPTEIYGDGSLVSNAYIYMVQAPLTIKNCSIEINDTNNGYGFSGYNGTDNEDLTIDNAIVKVTGEYGSIRNIASLTLTDCFIASPVGAVFDADEYAVVDANGDLVTEQIVIGLIETYELRIANVLVTNQNCNDLSQIAGVEGTATYNHTTKTLTLDGATISGYIANTGIEDLKITLVNENNINSNLGIDLIESTEFNGNGSLVSNTAIFTYDDLTIKDCSIEIKNPHHNCSFDGTDKGNLTIDNATVKADSFSPIVDFVSLTLIDCYIASPEGAVFDPDEQGVVNASGNIVYVPIVIAPIEEYDLIIAGIPVTNQNCNALNQIAGVEGTVTYNDTTKTLTLDGATINGTIENIGIEDLKITLVNENNITAYNGNAEAVSLIAATEINGNGSLVISGYIGLDAVPLTIKDCSVEIIPSESMGGIGGYTGEDEDLTIDHASLKVTGGTNSSISPISSLTLIDCAIITPEGAVFDADEGGVVDANGNVIKEQIVIEPIEKYGLEIAGVQVTDQNCNDLSQIAGVEGTVTYNNTTKTLTLDGATISGYIANTGIEDLKITLVNENNVTAYNGNAEAVSLLAATEINGNGSLVISGYIGLDAAPLAIKDCSVEINPSESMGGIGGYTGEDEDLTIDHASLKVTGGTNSSISPISSLTLIDCAIITPEGAVFDADEGGVVDANGNVIKEQIVIEPIEAYDLEIAGVSVTDQNCNDLSQIAGVEGTVTYDNTTKTLTLDGATINGIIENTGIENLKITLVNENNITNDNMGMNLLLPTEINGSGSLVSNAYIFMWNALSIKDCIIEINDTNYGWGFLGNDGTINEDLTIDNATVKATGEYGSIKDIASLTLIDCEIVSPEGAVYDTDKHAVVDANGNLVTEQIVIEPTDAISEVSMNSILVYPNPTADILNIDAPTDNLRVEIFNIFGQNILEISNSNSINLKFLPQGTYIAKIYNNNKVSVSKIIKK